MLDNDETDALDLKQIASEFVAHNFSLQLEYFWNFTQDRGIIAMLLCSLRHIVVRYINFMFSIKH